MPTNPDEAAGGWHCTSVYDFGRPGDSLTIREDCAVASGIPCTILFGDANLDIGGVIYDGCYSASHAGNALPASDKSVNRDWPHCFPPASAWNSVTVYITDDVFGSDIGGFYCIDLNNDGTCGSNADGEFGTAFCSQVTVPFVPNFAVASVYFVDGPAFQPIDCPTTSNPVGGTTGTINIWTAPTGPPTCSDGIDNDGDGFIDWGFNPGWPDRFDDNAGTGYPPDHPAAIGDGCDHIADDETAILPLGSSSLDVSEGTIGLINDAWRLFKFPVGWSCFDSAGGDKLMVNDPVPSGYVNCKPAPRDGWCRNPSVAAQNGAVGTENLEAEAECKLGGPRAMTDVLAPGQQDDDDDPWKIPAPFFVGCGVPSGDPMGNPGSIIVCHIQTR